ncbi:hypothetical protein CO251_15595 [Sulfobacillus sp. hq2]|nr:hypothetical protein CO251_15595 [Sulfobacillus sp. hq2]
MKRLGNDATLTRLGDVYQYLFVVKNCLELKENEQIYVEQYGDIAKISPKDSVQTEVKHHLSEHNLSDRSEDFWKSLRNWLKNYDYAAKFKSLILLTTSSIPATSAFYQWDLKHPTDRLSILKDIGQMRGGRRYFVSCMKKCFLFPTTKFLTYSRI